MAEAEGFRIMNAMEIVWFPPAVDGLAVLLRRRKHPAQVREALEQHLQAVAGDLSLAQPLDIFNGETVIYRFHCPDGDGGVYVQVTLELLPNNRIAVMECGGVVF